MLWAVTLCLFCGCKGDNPLQPKSGGRPYEVLLVDDDQGVVRSQLTVDMVGLPQPEPWFDVVLTDSAGYQSNGKTMRNVVKVDVSPGAVERTVLRYERNVFAAPQIIVHVVTPSLQALHNEMPQLGGRLRTLLNNAERRKQIRNALIEQTGKQYRLGPYRLEEKKIEETDPLQSLKQRLRESGIEYTEE